MTEQSRSPQWRTIYAQLRAEILAGRRRPGEQLPTHAEWTAQGVSQTPIAKAYRQLQVDGLAYSTHGIGTFVVEVLPAPGPDPLEALRAEVARLAQRVDDLGEEVAGLRGRHADGASRGEPGHGGNMLPPAVDQQG